MSKKANDRAEFMPVLENLDRMVHSIARLMILTFLYVVDEGDMVFLLAQTRLTWGNLSANVQKLKDAGYVEVSKSFVNNRPQTWVKLTNEGRDAYREYRTSMKQVLECLPD